MLSKRLRNTYRSKENWTRFLIFIAGYAYLTDKGVHTVGLPCKEKNCFDGKRNFKIAGITIPWKVNRSSQAPVPTCSLPSIHYTCRFTCTSVTVLISFPSMTRRCAPSFLTMTHWCVGSLLIHFSNSNLTMRVEQRKNTSAMERG